MSVSPGFRALHATQSAVELGSLLSGPEGELVWQLEISVK